MKKLFVIVVALIMALGLTACEYENGGAQKDVSSMIDVANELQSNQPTPTDIDYSLERYNLIRRTYWVNGMREKANMLPCEVEKPLGYIVLFTESGATVGSFVVDGKVSSLNSFLTPDSEFYEKDLDYRSNSTASSSSAYDHSNKWLADVDGSYGENDNGIFFFTPDGKYIEWTGTYLYSDIPMTISDPVIKFGTEGAGGE